MPVQDPAREQTTEFEMTVTESLVDEFARITGDFSSLHVNDAFARKTRFGRRVAHGMLLVTAAMGVRALWPRDIRFRRLKCRFLLPAHLNESVRFRIALAPTPTDSPEEHDFQLVGTRVASGERLIRLTGSFSEGESAERGRVEIDQGACFSENLSEEDRGVQELEDAQETLAFHLSSSLVETLRVKVLVPAGIPGASYVCANLASAMLLSTLVGMRLPGRRATFLGFDLSFSEDAVTGSDCRLVGVVRKVQLASQVISTEVAFQTGEHEWACGSVEALVNPAPHATPSCTELRQHAVDFGLQGRVALVVGGSRGIGAVTAKLLSLLGARVAITYHRGEDDARRIVRDICDAGGHAVAYACDVRDEAQVEALRAAAIDQYDGIDILVNSAVHSFSPSPIERLSWQDYLEELEVSVHGLHSMCGAVIPGMVERGRGKIINFSSVTVQDPVSGQSRYITAKGAVEAYTKSLAKELAKKNVQVNLVVPSMTETDLISVIPETFQKKLRAERDFGRNVDPVEVAQAVCFLASDWSHAMSGQSIVLNLGEAPFA